MATLIAYDGNIIGAAPQSSGGGGVEPLATNVSLTFTNGVATYTNSEVSADSRIMIYYRNSAVAQAAKIVSETGSGAITFTAKNTPTATVVCDILKL